MSKKKKKIYDWLAASLGKGDTFLIIRYSYYPRADFEESGGRHNKKKIKRPKYRSKLALSGRVR